MTHVENAIREAVEKGGYTKERMAEFLALHWSMTVLLDPLFWQALGRARGWQGKHDPLTDALVRRAHMHAFMTHLDEGKDTESFFAAL